jgi:hypothetical protein
VTVSSSGGDDGGVILRLKTIINGEQQTVYSLTGDDTKALKQLLDFIRRFGDNPVQAFGAAVLSFVATWVVSGFLNLGALLIRAVTLPFALINQLVVRPLGNLVLGLTGPVGRMLLDAYASVLGAVGSVTEPLGIAAPPVVTAIALGSAYLVYRLLVAYGKDVPVIGGTLRFLGVGP